MVNLSESERNRQPNKEERNKSKKTKFNKSIFRLELILTFTLTLILSLGISLFLIVEHNNYIENKFDQLNQKTEFIKNQLINHTININYNFYYKDKSSDSSISGWNVYICEGDVCNIEVNCDTQESKPKVKIS